MDSTQYDPLINHESGQVWLHIFDLVPHLYTIFFSVEWEWQQQPTSISCQNSLSFWILFSSSQERNSHMYPDFNWSIMVSCHSFPSYLSDGCQMVILPFISKYFSWISPSKVFYSKRIDIRGANSNFKTEHSRQLENGLVKSHLNFSENYFRF